MKFIFLLVGVICGIYASNSDYRILGWIVAGISFLTIINFKIDFSTKYESLPPQEYEPSDRQKRAIARKARKFARKILNNPYKYIILDTETTGIEKDDEIIELAICDLNGKILFNSKIRPVRKQTLHPKASEKNKITMKDLENAPTLAAVSDKLKQILSGKTVIAYNASFDMRLYRQSAYAAKRIKRNIFIPKKWLDLMIPFSEYYGFWGDERGSFVWQRLSNHSHSADHSAAGDCQATQYIITVMAQDKYKKC